METFQCQPEHLPAIICTPPATVERLQPSAKRFPANAKTFQRVVDQTR